MTKEEFQAEIQSHYRLMYRVAVLSNDNEALDAVHDAVLKLFDRRSQLKDVTNVKQYCLYTVRNICLNIIRSRKEYIAIDETTNIQSDENVCIALENREISDYVTKAMEHLPIDQKRVFQLSAFGGFSNVEIAHLLGVSQGNVRVILSRARKNIRVFLSK